MPPSSRFLFNFHNAFNDQLVAALDPLIDEQLAPANLAALDLGRGVYRLHYERPDLAYIGKADNLPTRLIQHMRKLQGRPAIDLAKVGFTCLYIEDSLMTASPEDVLIAHYKAEGDLPWNRSGFGNHDPGKRRDRQEPAKFDLDFPIDLTFPSGLPAGAYSANAFIREFNGPAGPPYDLRVELTRKPEDHPTASEERANAHFVLPVDTTAEESIECLVDALNAVCTPGTPEWTGAALYGRIVLYKTTEPYPRKLRAFG